MTNVIDINKPDPEFVFTDENNVKWFQYTASYVDDRGEQMTFSIWAENMEDADKRMLAIKNNGKIDGQLFSEIDE